MTLSHILTLGAFGESFSDPKLAKRLSWCLLTPYLPPINPIKYLREQNVLIAPQQAKTKPMACGQEMTYGRGILEDLRLAERGSGDGVSGGSGGG